MKVYKHAYFRINTPMYYKSKYGVGFEIEEDRILFYETAKKIFLNNGWVIKKEGYNGGCPTVTKDKQELYLHPQTFSGVIKEENISCIENLLSNSNIFKFQNTDIYEDVFDITDEEYINTLQSKIPEIEKDIMEAYKTKRSNLYITSSTPLEQVISKYRIKRLSHYVGVYSNSNIDWQFIESIFESLIEQKRIVTANTRNGKGYRTANKKELTLTADES
jgi:hypothetical protein